MDKVQNPINSECYTPSSEAFRACSVFMPFIRFSEEEEIVSSSNIEALVFLMEIQRVSYGETGFLNSVYNVGFFPR
jgi:sporulation-control protein spo0M